MEAVVLHVTALQRKRNVIRSELAAQQQARYCFELRVICIAEQQPGTRQSGIF